MHFEKCNCHNLSINTKQAERQTAVINIVSFRISMNLTFRILFNINFPKGSHLILCPVAVTWSAIAEE